MYYCCPKCGAIAEYNAYYGRITCTSCNWESEKKESLSQQKGAEKFKMAVNYDKYKNSKSTHWISNSGHDENGAYHGGKAADQTGGEWAIIRWYNRPWTCVLRHPDEKVAEMIADFAIDAALNDNIGYDQYERTSYWYALKESEYQPSKVKIKCEADCTAGVTANVKAVGYVLGVAKLKNVSTEIYSGNMKAKFKAAGFEVLTDKKYLNGYSYLKPGDILLYEGHHAATNLTWGKNAVKNEPEVPAAVDEIYISGHWYIREEPNKNAKALTVVKNGMTVEWLGEEQNGWLKVRYGAYIGWMSKRAKLTESKPVSLTVKKGNWYIRKEASVASKAVGSVKGGNAVKWDGKTVVTGWYCVEFNGGKGWISAKGIER